MGVRKYVLTVRKRNAIINGNQHSGWIEGNRVYWSLRQNRMHMSGLMAASVSEFNLITDVQKC